MRHRIRLDPFAGRDRALTFIMPTPASRDPAAARGTSAATPEPELASDADVPAPSAGGLTRWSRWPTRCSP